MLFGFEQQVQQAVCSVEMLAGLTACSRKIVLNNGDCYVWREQQKRATNLGINYHKEYYFLSQLSPLKFAPTPVYQYANGTILSWITGETLTVFSAITLEKLATHLAILHSLDLKTVNHPTFSVPFQLAERCQFLWQQLPETQQKNLPFSPPFPCISPFQVAICHHDIHLQNIIEQQGKLFLIDWEYCAISDPALDIALFFSANPLTEREQAVFLSHYFAKTGFNRTAFTAKMAEYRPEIEKLSCLWFLVLENSQ